MKILSVVIFLSFQSVVIAQEVYVSPNGNDANSGSISSPFKTLGKAASSVGTGGSVLFRGGEYPIKQDIFISGSEGSPITFRPYQGEEVAFVGTYTPGDTSYNPRTSVESFTVSGNWLVFQDLEIRNGLDGLHVRGGASNNLFDRLKLNSNYFSGFALNEGAAYNTILNTDSYNNYDALTFGQNADGFSLFDGIGVGNVISGSRSWGNGDDGFDFFRAGNSVTILNSLAYGNGIDNWNVGPDFDGNGIGFKLGIDDSPNQDAHLVINNKAWGNGRRGFDQNGNQVEITLFRNVAWDNGTDAFNFRDVPHELIQNIAAGPFTNTITGEVIQENNSFNEGGGYDVNADIISFNDSLITSARAEDGSIRNNGFLELVEGSGFYDPAVSANYPEFIALISGTAVPEPTTLGLLSICFFGWFVSRPARREARKDRQNRPSLSLFMGLTKNRS